MHTAWRPLLRDHSTLETSGSGKTRPSEFRPLTVGVMWSDIAARQIDTAPRQPPVNLSSQPGGRQVLILWAARGRTASRPGPKDRGSSGPAARRQPRRAAGI